MSAYLFGTKQKVIFCLLAVRATTKECQLHSFGLVLSSIHMPDLVRFYFVLQNTLMRIFRVTLGNAQFSLDQATHP
jgi:hypothetical protein